MSIPTFRPSKEADLLTWSAVFDAKINASPVTYGLDAAQATAYNALHVEFEARYAAVHDPNTNSKQATIAKDQAKDKLLYGPGGAWELVNIIQAFPGTTDAMRGELGLRIPDTERTPASAPGMPPDLSIVSTFARTISVRLRDQENPTRRGKPDGVEGATILYHVGAESPNDPSQWTFAKITSKTKVDVTIPASVPAGSKVWLTAFWFNARKETSIAATSESTRIADGLASAA